MAATMPVRPSGLGRRYGPESAAVSPVRNDTGSNARLGEFLASVERRAFVMARLSTREDDTALDAVQDTMLRMVRSYADRPEDQWPPLFFRILSNRLGDHHRRRGFARLLRWRGDEPDDAGDRVEAVDRLPSDIPAPDEALDAFEVGTALRRALDELPERQRQVFLLRRWQGMSVEETASALGISGGSVKTHLSRATSALRGHLREYASDEHG